MPAQEITPGIWRITWTNSNRAHWRAHWISKITIWPGTYKNDLVSHHMMERQGVLLMALQSHLWPYWPRDTKKYYYCLFVHSCLFRDLNMNLTFLKNWGVGFITTNSPAALTGAISSNYYFLDDVDCLIFFALLVVHLVPRPVHPTTIRWYWSGSATQTSHPNLSAMDRLRVQVLDLGSMTSAGPRNFKYCNVALSESIHHTWATIW